MMTLVKHLDSSFFSNRDGSLETFDNRAVALSLLLCPLQEVVQKPHVSLQLQLAPLTVHNVSLCFLFQRRQKRINLLLNKFFLLFLNSSHTESSLCLLLTSRHSRSM